MSYGYKPGPTGAKFLTSKAFAKLICGPVGTGKTFITECFAHEAALPVVKFLNFRSQWQGETEANHEKIFNILKSY